MNRSMIAKTILLCTIIPVALFAQMSIKFRGSHEWCMYDQYDQLFVNNNQETLVGQVMTIDTITPMRGMSKGIMLVLKTERSDEIEVHLGPSWFILNQDINLSVNDNNVEVRGCRTMINGKPVIMASTLVRKDRTLLLRDSDGVPYWCAWRKRFR